MQAMTPPLLMYLRDRNKNYIKRIQIDGEWAHWITPLKWSIPSCPFWSILTVLEIGQYSVYSHAVEECQ